MIFIYPNKKLKTKTPQITQINDQLTKTIKQLKDDLSNSDLGIGLAAPQIGKSLRIFGIKTGCHSCANDKCDCPTEICINTKIIDTFGQDKVYPQMIDEDNNQEDFLEGCLSVPNVYGTAKRWLKIKVSFQVIEKDKLVTRQEILEAPKSLVFQHEMDHLDGILFIDHIKEEKGKLYLQKDNQLEKITFKEIGEVFK